MGGFFQDVENFFEDTYHKVEHVVSTVYHDLTGGATKVYSNISGDANKLITGGVDVLKGAETGIVTVSKETNKTVRNIAQAAQRGVSDTGRNISTTAGNLSLPLMVGGGALLAYALLKK